MAVTGGLSFLMKKEEKVDRGDRSFLKAEVTDRDCLAEMSILCQHILQFHLLPGRLEA